jgi:hypothetical protein
MSTDDACRLRSRRGSQQGEEGVVIVGVDICVGVEEAV